MAKKGTIMARTELEDAERIHLVTILCDNSWSMGVKERKLAACKALEAATRVFRQAEEKLSEDSNGNHTMRVSICWLNGGFVQQDAHPDDLSGIGEKDYRCDGSTPLYERSLEVIRHLDYRIQQFLAEGRKVRGHVIWFSDGEANKSDPSTIQELKTLVSEALNPKSADGRSTTQRLNLFAIPIGEKARSFYEDLGVPDKHIFEVSDSMAEGFEENLVKAMRKTSILAVFGDNALDNTQGNADKLPGDIMLELILQRSPHKGI